jgi:hypothetical protein
MVGRGGGDSSEGGGTGETLRVGGAKKSLLDITTSSRDCDLEEGINFEELRVREY